MVVTESITVVRLVALKFTVAVTDRLEVVVKGVGKTTAQVVEEQNNVPHSLIVPSEAIT